MLGLEDGVMIRLARVYGENLRRIAQAEPEFYHDHLVGHIEAQVTERRPQRPPAMCFLDLAGYTRLTEERGDRAAAALATDLADLVERTLQAGLPPAHVGLHAGPVVFQDGDYFGRTVNLAARIAATPAPARC